jgi:hypothetical protein
MLEMSSETNTRIQHNKRVDGKDAQFSTKNTLEKWKRIPCQHFVNQKKLKLDWLIWEFQMGVYNGIFFEYFPFYFI